MTKFYYLEVKTKLRKVTYESGVLIGPHDRSTRYATPS